MRVLLVSAEYLPFRGGVAEVVAGLGEGLSGAGCRSTVLTRMRNPRGDGSKPGVIIKRYPSVPERFPRLHILMVACRVVTLLRGTDVTIAADYVGHRALSILPSALITRHRLWLYVHGSDVLQHALIGRVARRRRLFQRCRGVLANSFYAKGLVQRYFPSAEAHVVYPGIREDLFTTLVHPGTMRQRLHLPSDRPLVVCVGRLDPRKGQDTLIRSLPRVRELGLRPVVVLIGDGPYRGKLERIARETGSMDDVVFRGVVSDEEKIAWLDAADLVVQPSRQEGLMVEGLGLAMAEAGARGKTVLSSRHGGIPEVVLDGSTGVLVPEDAPPEIWAAETARLLNDADLRERLGKAARAHVASTFRWKQACTRVRDLLAGSKRMEG